MDMDSLNSCGNIWDDPSGSDAYLLDGVDGSHLSTYSDVEDLCIYYDQYTYIHTYIYIYIHILYIYIYIYT